MKTNTKRIAFISDHASPLAMLGGVDTGGQNVYVAQLARHLAAQGYVIDIFTRLDNAGYNQVVNWLPSVRVVHIKAGPEAEVIKEELLPCMTEFERNMLSFIRREKLQYQLVHANFFMSGLVALGIKRKLGIPVAVTFHALGHIRKLHQGEQDRFPVERLAIEEKIVREADSIIAECPQDRDDLINYYHARPERVTIIPCGFSQAEFYPIEKSIARKLLHLPEKERIILQLGRMVPRKGIDNVIKALAHLRNAGENLKLVIVGGDADDMRHSTNSEYGRLAGIARDMNVSDAVIFAGRKSRGQLKYYYSASDLFITTPWYEPFGITPLEAMACGTPVIGSDVGGIKYSVADGQTGTLVPPNDAAALAEKISAMIADKSKLAELGQNAISHVQQNFTWKKVALQMDELYQRVLRKQHVPVLSKKHEEQAA